MAKFFYTAIISSLFLQLKTSAQCGLSVNAGDDIYLCAPVTSTQLNGSISDGYNSFEWSPSIGLSNFNTLNPTVVNLTQPATYVLTATGIDPADNLVFNGDFESGNTGFLTDYIDIIPTGPPWMFQEGYFLIDDQDCSDPPLWCSSCPDHTSGSGISFTTHGWGIPNTIAWCQTVNVDPNVDYVFSGWFTHPATLPSGALIHYSINGTQIGPIFGSGSNCQWTNHKETWNSGSNSTAELCIITQNTSYPGIWFYIDDIAFGPWCVKSDTVQLFPVDVNATTSPTTMTQPCQGASLTLSGTGSSTGPDISYLWETIDGDISGDETTLHPVVIDTGLYILTVSRTNPDGSVCTETASVKVIANLVPLTVWITPPTPLGCDGANTNLIGNNINPGTFSYAWSTPNGNIVSGADQKNCIVNQPGTYNLTATNTLTGCTATTDTEVDAITSPPIAVASVSDTLTCLQNTVILFSAGSSFGANISYSWTTLNGHFVSGQSGPSVLVDSTGVYALNVLNTSNNCVSSDTVRVLGALSIPAFNLPPQQQITCRSDTIALSIQPSPSLLIHWETGNGGHIVSGQFTPNPVVDSTGDYTVTLQDTLTGCIARDTVHINDNILYPGVNIIQPGQITCQSLNVTISASALSTGTSFVYYWTASNGGHIISGDSTLNLVVNTAGNYTLSVLDTLNGCMSTASTVVAIDTNFVTAVANAPDTITCAQLSVSLNANGSSIDPAISYVWSTQDGHILSGANTPYPVVDSAGTYQLLMTNNLNGCFDLDTVSVLENALIPQIFITPPEILTCTLPAQNLVAQNNSPSGQYTYTWAAFNGGNITGSNTGLSVQVDAAGTYILSTTNNDNACISSDTVVVNAQNSAPAAEAGLPDTITCINTRVTLLANGPNPAASLNYQWATADGSINCVSNAAQAEAVSPGLYFVTVTDPSNGCSSVDSVQVFESTQLPLLTLASPGVLTCLVTTQTLQGQMQSPSGNLTYHWSASNGGNIVSGNNSLSPVIDAPGTYTLTVIDGSNGCTGTFNTTVTRDVTTPDILAPAPGQISCDFPVQTIQAQNLSLPGSFSYSWTATNGGHIFSGNNTLNPQIDAGGDYNLVATNLVNGCTSSIQVNLLQNTTPPFVDAGMDAILTCSFNSMTLNGSGAAGMSYSWTASSGGNISAGVNSPTPSIDAPGIYTLTVSDPANGCTNSDSVEIFNDANAPMVDAGTATQLNCSLLQTQLNATASQGPDFSYLWTASAGGNILSGSSTLTPLIDAPGVYTLVVTNAVNSCTHSSSVTVTEDILPPAVDAGVDGLLTCATTTLSLNGAQSGGSATYLWQTAGGNIVSGVTSLTAAINQPGTYTLIATLISNGCTGSDVATVAIDTIAPIFSIQPPQVLTCTQQSILLEGAVQQPAAGSFAAAWVSTNGHFISGQNTLNAVIDAPGTYMLTIQNTQNACDAVMTIPVIQNTISPLAVAQAGDTITCVVQSVMLDAMGSSAGNGFTYAWSTVDGQILNGANTLAPTVGAAGNYTLLVTNTGNGCTALAITTVTNNTTPPTIVIASPDQLTCVKNSITLNGNGSSMGTGFSAVWNGGNIVSGQYTLTPVVNVPGNYTLSIQNSQNGCTATQVVTVLQNITPPVAEAGEADTLHCKQLQVLLNGSSPTAGSLLFAWSSANGHIVSGATAQLSTVDAPGLYVLTVTNPANGCTAMDNVAVISVPAPEFDPALVQPDCHALSGSIDFGVQAGGQAPFTFSIDGGQTFGNQALIEDLLPGLYTLVVQDAFGCSASETVSIEPPLIPSLSIAALDLLDLGDSVLLQPVTNILSGLVNSWSWSPGTGLSCTDCKTPWAQPLQDMRYNLLLTDVNGCSAEAQVLVFVNQKHRIYAPNAFSPNGDGVNDFFMIFGKGVKEIRALQVYDRWGEALFHGEHLQANDEQKGWEGNYRGDPMTPAVFVWVARVEFLDGAVEMFSGDVTLMR
ncbi:MAG: gliding motility-associated C-terminal domain-containing protein [Saprospiraceae bacterium]|nr:gliding motility-associated C-terminal domain-containing protein [Saprospiraceae bacterium]